MVKFNDTQIVTLRFNCTPQQFTHRLLSGVPSWLTTLLDIRDTIVGRFGFATQSKPATVRIEIGQKIGPFTIVEVTQEKVVGWTRDSNIEFETTFTTATDSAGSSIGIMCTRTESRTALGAVYLRIIWPAHLLLMPIVLKSALKD